MGVSTFNIEKRGSISKSPVKVSCGMFNASYHPDYHGLRSAGVYAVTSIARERVYARFVVPDAFIRDAAFLNGYDQRLVQGRIEDKDALERSKSKFQEFQKAGGPALADFVSKHRGSHLISDASNYPFNEGHFVIHQGKLLPLPNSEVRLSGKHYVMDTTDGGISFPLVELGNRWSMQNIESAFFLAKIIHEGNPIGLLDRVWGTEKLSISDFRGHIGQIFHDDAYSEMNKPNRIAIHSQVIEYLRDPITYRQELQDILDGNTYKFGKYHERLPQNRFHHTYWIEDSNAQVHCVKTYSGISNPSEFPGVSFAEAPYFLQATAHAYEFTIRNAFIGTNGKDVRTMIANEGKTETISTMTDGTSLGNYFGRSLPNFVAVESVGHRYINRSPI